MYIGMIICIQQQNCLKVSFVCPYNCLKHGGELVILFTTHFPREEAIKIYLVQVPSHILTNANINNHIELP